MGTAARSGARPGPSRRATLRLGGSLLVLTPLLAACSSSSDAASEASAGYVSGDGVIVEIPRETRADPLEIRGRTYGNEEVGSGAMRGAALVVNGWYAAWPPCRVEAPALEAAHAEYSVLGVGFVGVNTRDKAGPAAAFEQTFGITYPSIPDQDGALIAAMDGSRSEEHTSELQSRGHLVCRLLLEKKNINQAS